MPSASAVGPASFLEKRMANTIIEFNGDVAIMASFIPLNEG